MGKKKIEKFIIHYLSNVVVTFLIIIMFIGVIFTYYTLLYNETRENIIHQGQIGAISSAEQINKYLSKGINTINLMSYSLDNMIRDGVSVEDIESFMISSTPVIECVTSGDSTGLYGYIYDTYIDSLGWIPDEGYNPIERPWYIGAKANIGRVAVVDPYLDSYTHTMMITLAKTLCDTKGVVAADFSMGRLQRLTEELSTKSGNSNVEIVLDRKYQVIAHSDKYEVGKNYYKEEDTFGSAVVDAMTETKDDNFSLTYNDKEYIGYKVKIENDWLCISLFDATKQLARLKKILNYTIITLILSVAVLLAIMVYSGRKSRLAQILNEQTKKAIAASEAKSSFLSNMSHEIRTPINAILGMNEMILRESEEENILTYSKNVRVAGNTLLGLVNDILDFSKIEEGKIEIIDVDYDISSMINDLVTMIQARADRKGLLLKLDFDRRLPKQLCGDEIRIKQVIANILTNAVKYTQEGSVTFRIGYERIPDDDKNVMLDVSVTDTGIGIKAEDIEKIFIKFERVEEERNRNIEGAGLGMTITKNLLEKMGSSLKVQSVYGEGSTFSFKLKQKVRTWEELGDYEEAYHKSLSKQKKYKEKFTAPQAELLVVDDVPMNLAVIKSLLKTTAVKIDTATSGDECIGMTHEKKYDLILLDHMMPGKDGIQTLREMRFDSENKNLYTPIICLTANAVAGARDEYLRKGFDDYLTKPIDTDRLEEMLMMYLPKEKIIKSVSGEAPKESASEKQSVPDWLFDIKALDVKKGLSHCGDAESYLETLKIYGSNAASSADEIDRLWESGDKENTTVKVHAIKSLSRAIGAEEIGSLAEKLELAGKNGEYDIVAAEIDSLTAQIRAVCEGLAPLCQREPEENAENLSEITEAELTEAYEGLLVAVSNMDTESANYIFNYLADYAIPESEKERFEKIKHAVSEFNWEEAANLLKA